MSAQRICGCGHRIGDHDDTRCLETWRPPDVLNPPRVWLQGSLEARPGGLALRTVAGSGAARWWTGALTHVNTEPRSNRAEPCRIGLDRSVKRVG